MSSATATTNTVFFDPTSINKQADVLYPVTATKAGLMTPALLAGLVTPAMLAELLVLIAEAAFVKNYSNDGELAPERPDADMVGATAEKSVMIWNVSDRAPNFAGSIDGGATFFWYDADGDPT
jgi:hypothetical protein